MSKGDSIYVLQVSQGDCLMFQKIFSSVNELKKFVREHSSLLDYPNFVVHRLEDFDLCVKVSGDLNV